jgi:phosphate acetyltransferase
LSFNNNYTQFKPIKINFMTKFTALQNNIAKLPAIDAVVLYPDNAEAILGAILAAREGYAKPIFLGDKTHMQKIATSIGENLNQYPIMDLSPQEAINEGVKMARNNQAQIIMKGSMHTDELMAEIVNKERGLRTGRRMTHCMVIDVPAYKKLLIISDAALNIAPDLTTKKDIIQNAINLACALGIEQPKVALLAAVETVNEKMPVTLEYAALSKMAKTGEITSGLVDGPLSFDLAISEKSAAIKKINSPVAGNADILIVPNIECGNILSKTLDYFANAISLGLILGAKVPIIVTSRSASAEARAGSCMLAKFYYYHHLNSM